MSENDVIEVNVKVRKVTDTSGRIEASWVRAELSSDPKKWAAFAVPPSQQLVNRVVTREKEGRPVSVPANFFELPDEQKASYLLWELLD